MSDFALSGINLKVTNGYGVKGKGESGYVIRLIIEKSFSLYHISELNMGEQNPVFFVS